MCAAQKLEKASGWLDQQRGGTRPTGKTDNELTKVVKDSSKVAEEQLKGLSNQVVKSAIFNRTLNGAACQQEAAQPAAAAPQ